MLSAIALLVATAGSGVQAPTDAEVLRALRPATRGMPFVVGEFRDDITIVKKPIAKTVGAVRVYPLIGFARPTTTQWECAAYYTRTVQLGFPFSATVKTPCVHVAYFDTVKVDPYTGE